MTNRVLRKLASHLTTAVEHHSINASALARRKVLRTASVLIRELAEPVDLLAMHRSNMFELVTIRAMLKTKILHMLPASGSISAANLAVKSGMGESLTLRLLRMAAVCQMVEQGKDGCFVHTKFSRAYTQCPGYGNTFNLLFTGPFLPLAILDKYLAEKGFEEPREEVTSPNPWYYRRQGQTFWEVLEADQERFDDFQKGLGFLDTNYPVVGAFDWGKLYDPADPERTLVVDIGGGLGQTLADILREHPAVPPAKVVLQELPKVAEEAKAVGNLPAETKIMAHDFYTPQPVQHAKAYLLRRIIHDYSDEVCIKILQSIAQAMSADSMVLISDFVVPEVISPNDIEVATSDVLMLCMAGKERSVKGFRKLLEAAGLELCAIHSLGDGNYGLLEGRLKSSGKKGPRDVSHEYT